MHPESPARADDSGQWSGEWDRASLVQDSQCTTFSILKPVPVSITIQNSCLEGEFCSRSGELVMLAHCE